MKLFHIKATDEAEVGYDCNHAFVIRAKNEGDARRLAAEAKGGEDQETWLDPILSTCEELSPKGEAEIILADFNAG